MAQYPFLDADGTIVIAAPVVEITGVTTFTGATTVTGDLTITGDIAVTGELAGTTRPVTIGTDAEVAVTAAQSGMMFVGTATSGTQEYTLPDAAAGLWYTFVAGHASSEITVTPQEADLVVGKIHGAENATGIAPSAGLGIVNTGGTNVVGDFVTLVAANDSTWYMVAVAGVWAADS